MKNITETKLKINGIAIPTRFLGRSIIYYNKLYAIVVLQSSSCKANANYSAMNNDMQYTVQLFHNVLLWTL